jgi:hypothetical protein
MFLEKAITTAATKSKYVFEKELLNKENQQLHKNLKLKNKLPRLTSTSTTTKSTSTSISTSATTSTKNNRNE